MSLFLAILLLILTTTATIAAFGGETWHKGAEPLLKRVTVRGWVSLFCLFLTFAVGVVKEVGSASDNQHLSQQRDKANSDLDSLRSSFAEEKANARYRHKELIDVNTGLLKKLGNVEYRLSVGLERLPKSDPAFQAVQQSLKDVQLGIQEAGKVAGVDQQGKTVTEVSVVGPTGPGEYTLEARVVSLDNAVATLEGNVVFFVNGQELRGNAALFGDRADFNKVELAKGTNRVAAQFIPDPPGMFRGSRSKLVEYEVK